MLITLVSGCTSEQDKKADQLYSEALTSYTNKDYVKSRELVEVYLRDYPKNKNISKVNNLKLDITNALHAEARQKIENDIKSQKSIKEWFLHFEETRDNANNIYNMLNATLENSDFTSRNKKLNEMRTILEKLDSYMYNMPEPIGITDTQKALFKKASQDLSMSISYQGSIISDNQELLSSPYSYEGIPREIKELKVLYKDKIMLAQQEFDNLKKDFNVK